MKNNFSCKIVLINTESTGLKENLWSRWFIFVAFQHYCHQRSDVIPQYHLFLSYVSPLRNAAGLCTEQQQMVLCSGVISAHR